MKHLGDYAASKVIYGKFTTFRPSTGAAFTLAGTPALSVYKDNSTTQSTTGVTLTADFDGVTGLNHFAIDTGADGTFYSAGSNFDIVITTGTVDSVSVVGSVVASFSIAKDSSLKPTTDGRTLDVTTTGEAGVDFANIGAPAAGAVPQLGIIDNGTAQAATSTTLQLRAAAAFANDEILGAVIVITGGSAGVGQARVITDYVSSTDTATVDAWQTTPTGTITYAIFAAPPPAVTPPAVNVTQWLGSAVATPTVAGVPEVDLTHVAGTAQTAGDIIADTNDIQSRLPAALVSGRMDASVGAMAANVITAAATAADFGTEVGTAVWATTTRELTGGTNIVLAKGVGVTGFNDLDAAGVRGAVGLAAANLDTQLSGINSKTTNLPTDPADESLIIAATDAIMTRLGTPAGASVSADVAAVKLVTDKVDDLIELSSDGYIFTALALQESPAGSSPTAAAIADAVWEEAIAAHSGTVGSTAEALNAAGAAGDPWITALPGAYGAGTAGFLLGTNLDAKVSDVLADTNDLQTRVPAALVSGRMDASVGAMAANVMTAAAAAADLTTELQSGLATGADLAVVAGYIDTEVAAIKAVTEKLDTMIENSSDGWIWTIASLQQGPSLDAVGVRAAIGLASANLDTQLDALPTAAENATAVMGSTVEGTFDLTESARLWNAALAGKASGLAGTAAVFRDLADSKDRITATVDADGNRTAVTRDVT